MNVRGAALGAGLGMVTLAAACLAMSGPLHQSLTASRATGTDRPLISVDSGSGGSTVGGSAAGGRVGAGSGQAPARAGGGQAVPGVHSSGGTVTGVSTPGAAGAVAALPPATDPSAGSSGDGAGGAVGIAPGQPPAGGGDAHPTEAQPTAVPAGNPAPTSSYGPPPHGAASGPHITVTVDGRTFTVAGSQLPVTYTWRTVGATHVTYEGTFSFCNSIAATMGAQESGCAGSGSYNSSDGATYTLRLWNG